MKYVNITTGCYNSITKLEDKIVSFNTPIVSLSSKDDVEGNVIGGFFVVTQLSFLGTDKPEMKKENLLELRETVDIIIRLTKCDPDPQKRICFDLDEFTINFREEEKKGNIKTACFDFFNQTRITEVKKLTLPAKTGNYVLKVLIKKTSDPIEKTSIQSMNQVFVSAE